MTTANTHTPSLPGGHALGFLLEAVWAVMVNAKGYVDESEDQLGAIGS